MHTLSDSARRFGDVAQQTTTPEFSEAYRDTPARAPSVEADWSVPARRALMTGILFGPVIGGAVGIATPGVKFGDDLLWCLVITGGAIAASWLFFLARSDSTLWIREKLVNQDINKDGHIGQPSTVRLEIEDHEDGRDREIWVNLPLPRRGYAGLITFAKAVASQGESFSERTAADHGYTRTQWQDMRTIFIDNGWAEWNHPNEERQGVTLLRHGKMILLSIAREGIPRERWMANE